MLTGQLACAPLPQSPATSTRALSVILHNELSLEPHDNVIYSPNFNTLCYLRWALAFLQEQLHPRVVFNCVPATID